MGSDERVRIEARTTLLANAACLLVDGVPAAVRRDEVVNMAAVWLRQALPPVAQRLRDAGSPASRPRPAPTLATSRAGCS